MQIANRISSNPLEIEVHIPKSKLSVGWTVIKLAPTDVELVIKTTQTYKKEEADGNRKFNKLNQRHAFRPGTANTVLAFQQTNPKNSISVQ